ncbi:DUF3043 domain-containing protein [Schaalia sp. ZJ405]|uniref:DUF3043 domain-containing protein n=1 Tax=unclassified Schaalia TaxID=2691889 RepID=UPI0013EBCDE6|nr:MULTISPECIES: DUF3043 domain-containing protein [unclassified Schaalia]QPK80558.1 DUF3043 domain-containing protein [Schaalia sp. ZJ405]
MFKREKKETAASSTQPVAHTGAGTKKGRPTPTRKEAQRRNDRPLVPADRKEAKRQAKERRNAQFQREQMALETGDERFLPLRDKGRVRRFVRDWVDARWSFSEFLMPIMLLFLVAMMTLSLWRTLDQVIASYVMISVTSAMYTLFAISIIEGIVVWQRLKRKIRDRYPNDEIPKGTWYYCFSRMIMARRWRSPKPQKARGEFPTVKAKKS